jgi:O-acetyl-ADP-ribose deacetylase (regulator of RNase III)
VSELAYLNLDLLLERAEPAYRVRILASPAGETRPASFRLPFSDLALEHFLLKIGRPRGNVRRISGPQVTAIKDFGGRLFEAVFPEELRVNLASSQNSADGMDAGLRIRLRFSDCPELSQLPWEYLYDRETNRFLCLSDRTPLMRYLEVPYPVRVVPVTLPLRILVIIANPSDLQQLDAEQEWRNITAALSQLTQRGRVEVERLEKPTLSALHRQQRRHTYHILHFIGHGGFDSQTQDGMLAMEDDHGRSRLVAGKDLGTLQHDHRSLRLAVLNSRDGGRSDRSDPFSGTAQSLIQQGIPAVVAMQFEITDNAAITFSHVLYEAIADGYPLDAATTEARKAIYADGNQIEWGAPALYLRGADGRIFDIQDRLTPVIATEEQARQRAEEQARQEAEGRARQEAAAQAQREAADLVNATRVYRLGESDLALKFGEITTSKAQVLVSSDDYFLSMGGGVSAKIRLAGGNTIPLDAAKHIPLQVGDVAVTTAGALPARFIFHAVTLGPGGATTPTEEIIRRTTAKCLALLKPLGASSIAFPAIGAGAAGFAIDDVAVHMAEIIAADLLARNDRIEVAIYLFDRSRRLEPLDFLKFFEEFARRTPTISSRIIDPSPSLETDSSLSSVAATDPRGHYLDLGQRILQLEHQRQLLEERIVALRREAASNDKIEAVRVQLQKNQELRLQRLAEQQAIRDQGIEVFISYAHEDETLRQRLGKALSSLRREGLITDWHDREITAGSEWSTEIDQHLDSARVILVLLSFDFFASDYCYGFEMTRALERHRAGDARVIPVVLRAVDWTHSPLGKLQALPKDGKPVTSWPDQDSAFLDVTEGIRAALRQLAAK